MLERSSEVLCEKVGDETVGILANVKLLGLLDASVGIGGSLDASCCSDGIPIVLLRFWLKTILGVEMFWVFDSKGLNDNLRLMVSFSGAPCVLCDLLKNELADRSVCRVGCCSFWDESLGVREDI